MKQYASAVAGIDSASITASVAGAKAIVKVAKAIPNEGGLVSLFTGESDLASFAKKLVPFGQGMKQYASAVAGIDSGSISASVSAAKELMKFINSTAGIDTSGVGSFTTALSKLGRTSIDGFIKSFSSASGKLKNIGSTIFTNITGGMKSKQSMLNTTMTSAINNMVKAANSKKAEFGNIGKALITMFINGLKSRSSQTSSAILVPIRSAVTAIRSSYSNFYNAGAYISSGLAAGMKSKLHEIKSAATQMANAADKAARAALVVKSPSRVFYAIGEFVVQGFTNALNDGDRSAYIAASEMANSARAGFNKAISSVSDFLIGEIDTQPTIRPILDLSDVSEGAGSISSMFNMSPSVRALSNVGKISSMMAGYSQNGNADVIYAIDKLRKSIGSVGGDVYNINGITYDDGTNVSNAVETLVRAARIERRV